MTSTGDRGKKRRRQEKAGEDRQKTGRRADKYLRICCDRSSHDSCQNSGQDNSSSGAARPRRLASRDASRIPQSATIVDFHGIAEHCQAKRSYKKSSPVAACRRTTGAAKCCILLLHVDRGEKERRARQKAGYPPAEGLLAASDGTGFGSDSAIVVIC